MYQVIFSYFQKIHLPYFLKQEYYHSPLHRTLRNIKRGDDDMCSRRYITALLIGFAAAMLLSVFISSVFVRLLLAAAAILLAVFTR